MFTKPTLGLVAALTALAAAGLAQTPTTPPAHRGILSRIFHKPTTATTRPTPGGPGFPGGRTIAGGIIGNKKTHVYHLPGDPGALPAPQNRVYFRTQAQAAAAGYHRAGVSHGRPAVAHHH